MIRRWLVFAAAAALTACSKQPAPPQEEKPKPKQEGAQEQTPTHETTKPPERGWPTLKTTVPRQEHRSRYIDLEEILDKGLLTARPGMTVLDIGTGPGLFAFIWAERLAGTGQVYATDVLPDRIDYVKQEAATKGLKNVTPVLVAREGLDPFYLKQKYDMVFACNVFHRLGDIEPGARVRYLKELRSQFNEGGRLALIMYRQGPPLTLDDFTDINGAIRNLAQNTKFDPFYLGLSESTRKLVDQTAAGAAIDQALREAVIADFNKLMTDPSFFRQFFGEKFFAEGMLNETERDFANWLILTLREDGAYKLKDAELPARQARAVRKLNGLFFASRFRKFLYKGRVGFYVPGGDVNRQVSSTFARGELEEAGYVFEAEHIISPYYTLSIYKPQ